MIEDHIGAEINTFFNFLLPESKGNDQFKINTLVASKSKTDNTYLETCLSDILTRPELNYVILTKELSEQLSTIIKEIYRKTKKKIRYETNKIISLWQNNKKYGTDNKGYKHPSYST